MRGRVSDISSSKSPLQGTSPWQGAGSRNSPAADQAHVDLSQSAMSHCEVMATVEWLQQAQLTSAGTTSEAKIGHNHCKVAMLGLRKPFAPLHRLVQLQPSPFGHLTSPLHPNCLAAEAAGNRPVVMIFSRHQPLFQVASIPQAQLPL